jgi:hypothetical protein
MPAVIYALLSALGALFRSQLALRFENVALRHQLAVYQRTVKRPSIRPADRIFWSWLSRGWASWRQLLVFVQPDRLNDAISGVSLRYLDYYMTGRIFHIDGYTEPVDGASARQSGVVAFPELGSLHHHERLAA